MKCKKIRELLLADYPDNELEERLKIEVEEHLRICFECREFEHALRKTAIEPFKKATRVKPRDAVWHRIQEAVVFEKRTPSKNLPEKLQDLFQRICLTPKTAFTLASVIIVALIVTFMAITLQTGNQKIATVQPKEEIEYLSDFIGENEYFFLDENGGYNTTIEEYFL